MKTIRVPGPARELGVRLTREVAPGCTPDIAGLFLQDENLDWNLTEKEISLSANMYSFLPVRLVGNICDAEVNWSTLWQPSGYGGVSPIFFGSGPVGVVGWYMWHSTSVYFSVTTGPGVLTISADCGGKTYGPVRVTFSGGGYY